MSMDSDALSTRIGQLISDGWQVPLRPREHQYDGEEGRLEPGPYARWRTRCIAALSSFWPTGHTYQQQFESLTTPSGPLKNDPRTEDLESGIGVLEALQADVDAGFLVGLQDLISAEVFSDFLGMAQHLHEQGYVHGAASVAGAVLEDSLRRHLKERGKNATGNLESMNQIALDTGLYTPLVFQQVKVWIAIRNHADHGEWEKVEPVQVQTMIIGIVGFLRESLNLP